jgi:hypothetical protein
MGIDAAHLEFLEPQAGHPHSPITSSLALLLAVRFPLSLRIVANKSETTVFTRCG